MTFGIISQKSISSQIRLIEQLIHPLCNHQLLVCKRSFHIISNTKSNLIYLDPKVYCKYSHSMSEMKCQDDCLLTIGRGEVQQLQHFVGHNAEG